MLLMMMMLLATDADSCLALIMVTTATSHLIVVTDLCLIISLCLCCKLLLLACSALFFSLRPFSDRTLHSLYRSQLEICKVVNLSQRIWFHLWACGFSFLWFSCVKAHSETIQLLTDSPIGRLTVWPIQRSTFSRLNVWPISRFTFFFGVLRVLNDHNALISVKRSIPYSEFENKEREITTRMVYAFSQKTSVDGLSQNLQQRPMGLAEVARDKPGVCRCAVL